MSTVLDTNFSINNHKSWNNSLEQIDQVSSNNGYVPIEQKTDLIAKYTYNPEILSSVDSIAVMGFSNADKEFLSPYTDVAQFEKSVQAVLITTTAMLTDLSVNLPTSINDLSNKVDQHVVNISMSFGDVLKILVDLLESMSALCPEFKAIIDNLHKVGEDRMNMSKIITFIKQTIIDLQHDIITAEQQKAREAAVESAKWGIIGAAIGCLIAAVTLISAIPSAGASLAVLPAVIGLLSATYSMANALAKHSWLKDNAENTKDEHTEELRGGILTAWFGMSPDKVHTLEDMASFVQIVLSVGTTLTSVYNTAMSVKLAKMEIKGAKTGIITNVLTAFVGGFTAAQDISCKIADFNGNTQGAQEGILFEGISDPDDSATTWFGSRFMRMMLDMVGNYVIDPLSHLLPDVNKDDVVKQDLATDDATKRQMARMFLSIVSGVVSQLGATYGWNTEWDKEKDIADLIKVRKRIEQLTLQTSKWAILSQLIDITAKLNEMDFLQYQNAVQMQLKQLDSNSTRLQGIEQASAIVLENLIKIYQEYMKILGKTMEDLESSIKRAVDSFDSGVLRAYKNN
jgi:hypothetical protein